jgi:hypothetical protein
LKYFEDLFNYFYQFPNKFFINLSIHEDQVNNFYQLLNKHLEIQKIRNDKITIQSSFVKTINNINEQKNVKDFINCHKDFIVNFATDHFETNLENLKKIG